MASRKKSSSRSYKKNKSSYYYKNRYYHSRSARWRTVNTIFFVIAIILAVVYFRVPLWKVHEPYLFQYTAKNVVVYLDQGIRYLSFSWFGFAAYYLPFFFLYLIYIRSLQYQPSSPKGARLHLYQRRKKLVNALLLFIALILFCQAAQYLFGAPTEAGFRYKMVRMLQTVHILNGETRWGGSIGFLYFNFLQKHLGWHWGIAIGLLIPFFLVLQLFGKTPVQFIEFIIYLLRRIFKPLSSGVIHGIPIIYHGIYDFFSDLYVEWGKSVVAGRYRDKSRAEKVRTIKDRLFSTKPVLPLETGGKTEKNDSAEKLLESFKTDDKATPKKQQAADNLDRQNKAKPDTDISPLELPEPETYLHDQLPPDDIVPKNYTPLTDVEALDPLLQTLFADASGLTDGNQAVGSSPDPLPPVSLLQPTDTFEQGQAESFENLTQMAETICDTTRKKLDFRMKFDPEQSLIGPTVSLLAFDEVSGQRFQVKNLKSVREDYQVAVRRKPIDIRIEDRIYVEIPHLPENRLTIPVSYLVQTETKDEGRYAVPIGITTLGDIQLFDLDKGLHFLIGGSSGSGKTVFLHSLIFNLIYRLSAEELKLCLIDLKGSEFSVYENLPHLWQGRIIDNVGDVDLAIESLNDEMSDRAQQQKKDRRASFVPLVTVIDEYAEYEINRTALERLVAKGRAFRMHFIIATQNPKADIINTNLRANLVSAVAFKTRGHVESQLILNTSGAEHLCGKGDCLYRSFDGAVHRLQGALVSSEELIKLHEYYKNLKGTNGSDETDS